MSATRCARDALGRAAQLRPGPQPLDAARLQAAETSSSAARNSGSASAAIADVSSASASARSLASTLQHVRDAGLLARARALEETPDERDLHVEVARPPERLGIAPQHPPGATPCFLLEAVGEHVERAGQAPHGHAHVVQRLGVARAHGPGRDAGEVLAAGRDTRRAAMRRGSPGPSSTVLAGAISQRDDRDARRPCRARPPRGYRPCRTTAARPGAPRRRAG